MRVCVCSCVCVHKHEEKGKGRPIGVYEKRQRLTTDRKIGICIVRGLFMIQKIGPSKSRCFSKDLAKPKERSSEREHFFLKRKITFEKDLSSTFPRCTGRKNWNSGQYAGQHKIHKGGEIQKAAYIKRDFFPG